jgi:tetratricopeptide (TPR) repeat protein
LKKPRVFWYARGVGRLVWLLALVSAASSASAQVPTATTARRPMPPTSAVAPVNVARGRPVAGSALLAGQEEILERLEARASYLRKGDLAAADVELGHLIELRESLGPTNMPLASSTLVERAEAALRLGDVRHAMIDADAAARLSPDLPAAHWMRVRVAWALGENRLPMTLDALRRAVGAEVGSFSSQVALLLNLVTVGFVAFGLFVVGLVIATVVRYLRVAGTDFARGLPEALRERAGVLGLLTVLVLPLTLGLGVLTALTIVLVLVMPYLSLRERVPMTLVLLGVASLPWGIERAATLLVYPGSIVEALVVAESEAFAPEAERRLSALAQASRPDYDAAFLLAMRARVRGELEVAERAYQQALVAKPGDAAATNNLGTLAYLQRRRDEALDLFRRASGAARSAEPYLNVASLLLEQGRFDEARAAVAQAAKFDRALTVGFNDAEGGTAQRLLDLPYDDSQLWTRLAVVEPEVQTAIMEDLWSRFAGPIPPTAFSFGVLLALLAGWGLALRRPQWFSAPCARCGAAADRTRVEGCCSQCISIYLSAAQVDAAMRLAKERSVRRRALVSTWLERLLVPFVGLGAWVGGRPIEALLLWVPFTIVLGGWIVATKLRVAAWGLPGPPTSVPTFVLLSISAPLVLVAAWRAFGRGD